MSVDLHCHTKMSDGSTGIDELIFLAKKMNVDTLAVTDHDTFAGAKRAKVIGQRYGIDVIMGAEFSAFDYSREKNVHILCYLCDNPDRLEGLCKTSGECRKQDAIQILHKIMRFYPISPEMVLKKAQGSTNIFKNHIMQAIMDAGYSSVNYSKVFDKLFNPIDGVAKTQVKYPDVCDVIKQIHIAGGVAVLAHPNLYGSLESIDDLVSYGLDGIEVWSPYSDDVQKQYMVDVADKYNLVMTGGSDFHGMYSKSVRPIGLYTTPKEQLNKLIKCKKKW